MRGPVWVVFGCLALVACTGDEERAATPEVDAPAPTEPATDTAPTTAAADGTPSAATPETTGPATTEPSAPDQRCGTVAAPAAPVSITVWHTLSGDAEGFIEAEVAEFEAEYPSIEVVLEQPESWPAGVPELAELDQADRPDAMLASEMTARLQADSGRFVPVEECAGFTVPEQFIDLAPIVDATYRVDGVLWAAPYNVSTPVMLYDANRWSEAGLDPSNPPTDIDELAAAIRTLQDSGAAASGAVMYDRSAMWFVTVPALRREQLLLLPDNGHGAVEIDDVDLATEDAIATLEQLRVLRREGYIDWVGINQSGRDDLVTLIVPAAASGMTFHTSASLGDIYRLDERGQLPDVEITTAPFPAPGAGGSVGGGAWWVLDRELPDERDAAWLFVDWITQPERTARLAAFTGYVPPTARAANDPAWLDAVERWPALAAGYEQVWSSPTSFGGFSLQAGPQVQVWRELEVAAAEVIDLDRDPAEALSAAEGRIDAILESYAEVTGDG